MQTREYNQGFRSNLDNLCSGKWNVTTLVWKEKYFFLSKNNEEVGKSHQALWQRYKELSNPKNKDAEDRACARGAPCRNPEQMEVPVGT